MQRWRVVLAIGMLWLTLGAEPQAQDPLLDFPAESMVRLTGILQLGKQPPTSAYPLLTVWLGETSGQLQVTHGIGIPAGSGKLGTRSLCLRRLDGKATPLSVCRSQLYGLFDAHRLVSHIGVSLLPQSLVRYR